MFETERPAVQAMPEIAFPTTIDNTLRAAWKKCPTQARYAFFNRLGSTSPNTHRHAGGAFASGLEATRRAYFGDGLNEADSLALGIKALTEAYGDFEPPDVGTASNKTLDRMVEALIAYFEKWPLDTDKLRPVMLPEGPAVEFTFAIPLTLRHPDSGDPLLYSGRFDMLADKEGTIWVDDEKTTTALGPTWAQQWDLDSQMTGYCHAARRYGFPAVGAIIRGIGILKTRIDCIEVPVFRPEWMINRWLKELHADIQEMINAYLAKDYRMALSHACADFGGCAFRSLCLSPEPEKWVPGRFSEHTWDPLAKGE